MLFSLSTKKTRERVLRSIEECFADAALHDQKYRRYPREREPYSRLISLEDLGHCAGIPHLEEAIVHLFKHEAEISKTLREDGLKREKILSADWFKDLVNKVMKYKSVDRGEMKKDNFHPFLLEDGRKKEDVYNTCMGVVLGINREYKTLGNPPGIEKVAAFIIRDLLGLEGMRVKRGQIEKNGDQDFVPFVIIDQRKLEHAKRVSIRS